jgi:hypothetical protein
MADARGGPGVWVQCWNQRGGIRKRGMDRSGKAEEGRRSWAARKALHKDCCNVPGARAVRLQGSSVAAGREVRSREAGLGLAA